MLCEYVRMTRKTLDERYVERTMVALTPAVRIELDAYCARVDRPQSYVVRQAITEFLARDATKGKGSK